MDYMTVEELEMAEKYANDYKKPNMFGFLSDLDFSTPEFEIYSQPVNRAIVTTQPTKMNFQPHTVQPTMQEYSFQTPYTPETLQEAYRIAHKPVQDYLMTNQAAQITKRNLGLLDIPTDYPDALNLMR